MRLLLNYKGINKIMLNVQSYNDVVRFVRDNFCLKLSKWSMSYTDSDGDQISLDSQLDFQTMLDTVGKEHLKVYISDRESEEHDVQIGQQINIDIQPTESKIEKADEKVEPEAEVEQKIEEQKIEVPTQKKNIEEIIPQKIKQEISSGEVNENQNFDYSKCHRGMWKKKIQQKMAKFVDQRVEALIPCIVKKVEDQLKNKEQKPIKTEGVKHQAKCNGCGIEPIVGIRYKCVKCPKFDLCENCEAQITHNHNMIKMKQIEQESKEEQGFPMWKPWGKRFHPGFMPPPPFKMGEGAEMPKFPFPCPPFMQPPSHPVAGFMIPNKKDKEDKEKSCDPRLKITKKCFKMSKLFGGQPKNYEEFVTKNQDLKLDELSQVYVAMNEGAHISGEQLEKGMEKANKLAFYFKTAPQNYTELIKKNPAANFRQLIKLVSSKKEQKVEQKIQEKKPQIKVEQIKTEPKIEQKMEQKNDPKVPVPPPLIAPLKPAPRKSPFDIKKRNQCVLALKDLFGDEKVYDYIGFFNQNSELSKQEIIESYILKLTSKN